MSCDKEFICQSCGHTFDSEPPFHDRPTECPQSWCRSDEITTIEEYDLAMKLNSERSNNED